MVWCIRCPNILFYDFMTSGCLIYLEPKRPLFWLEKTFFFGGGGIHAWIPGVISADTSDGKKFPATISDTPLPVNIETAYTKQQI